MQYKLQSHFTKITSIWFPGKIKKFGNREEIPERQVGGKE